MIDKIMNIVKDLDEEQQAFLLVFISGLFKNKAVNNDESSKDIVRA